jgi:hypothetical protein
MLKHHPLTVIAGWCNQQRPKLVWGNYRACWPLWHKPQLRRDVIFLSCEAADSGNIICHIRTQKWGTCGCRDYQVLHLTIIIQLKAKGRKVWGSNKLQIGCQSCSSTVKDNDLWPFFEVALQCWGETFWIQQVNNQLTGSGNNTMSLSLDDCSSTPIHGTTYPSDTWWAFPCGRCYPRTLLAIKGRGVYKRKAIWTHLSWCKECEDITTRSWTKEIAHTCKPYWTFWTYALFNWVWRLKNHLINYT